MKVKQGLLLLALLFCLGTALAIAISGQAEESPDVVDAVEKDDKQDQHDSDKDAQARVAVSYDLSAIKRAAPESVQVAGLFGSKSWYVPPPPPVTPVSALPPPPPSPPSLAFTFLGRIIDKGEVTIFLSKNGHHYTAKVNDVLDDNYRVDKIAATNAVLTYIPLNVQQTLAFNSTAIGSSALNEVMSQATTSPSTSAVEPITK